jgi:hypothetical protein
VYNHVTLIWLRLHVCLRDREFLLLFHSL